MSARLTIIVPTYNRSDLLAKCLASLRAQSFQDFEILVVDDGSDEDIKEFVSSSTPGARVVRLESNSGFAVAVNAGLREATSELVMLLNNDMTLDPDCIEKLVQAIDADEADMVAPLVLWRDDPGTVYSAGDRMLKSGRPEAIGFRCPRRDFVPSEPVFGVSAGAAIYKGKIFERIGLLDERFVAYFEDADLCFRARLAGFRASCVIEAVAYHVGSASQSGKTWWRSRQCYRNHALLVLKNMPSGLLIRNGGAIAAERLHQAGMVMSSARAEFGIVRALLVWLRVCLEWLRFAPAAFAARRDIQRNRTISTQSLANLLSDRR